MRFVLVQSFQINPNSVSRGYQENSMLSQALDSKAGTRLGSPRVSRTIHNLSDLTPTEMLAGMKIYGTFRKV